MPPWSARLLANTHPSQAPSAPSTHNDRLSRRPDDRVHPTMTNSESLTLIPTLHPSPRGGLSRQGTRHGRSLSHPFPGMFGVGRKQDKPSGGLPAREASHQLTDDDSSASETETSVLSPSTSSFWNRGKTKPPREREFTQGKCMTCDSMMRWPSDVKTFRCTVCYMVNDLKPINEQRRPSRQEGAPQPRPAPRKPPPLSIERTESIVDHCMNVCFEKRGRDSTSKRPRSPLPALTVPDSNGPMSYQFPQPPEGPRSPGITDAYPSVQNLQIPNPDVCSGRPSTANASVGFSQSLPGENTNGFAHMGEASSSNRAVPKPPTRVPPRPPSALPNQGATPRPHAGNISPERSPRRTPSQAGIDGPEHSVGRSRHNAVFGPLEEYIVTSFASWQCVNSSFSSARPAMAGRAASEGARKQSQDASYDRGSTGQSHDALSTLDAKTLLLGDLGENALWWSGGRNGERNPPKSLHGRNKSSTGDVYQQRDLVNPKSPCIDWTQVNAWFSVVLHAGRNWRSRWRAWIEENGGSGDLSNLSAEESDSLRDLEEQIEEGRYLVHRTLLKATEHLLKRPSRPMKTPEDLRFLLILLANPLFYTKSTFSGPTLPRTHSRRASPGPDSTFRRGESGRSPNPRSSQGQQHSGLIKRILGLLANVPDEAHHYLVIWFSRYSESHFRRTVDLVGGFVTHRLIRQQQSKTNPRADPTEGLIPNITGPGAGTSAQLHAALGVSGPSKAAAANDKSNKVDYADDWQLKAAAKVMALLFTANNSGLSKKTETVFSTTPRIEPASAGLAAKQRAHRHGQILPTSDFYNTLLDYYDLVADFENWETYKSNKFSFCQFPFFLSIWAKIRVLEFDARRQMEVKAREAFFDSILSNKIAQQHLVLKVRRDCLVEDSLKNVSAVVGTGPEEIKKGLRIVFRGEEGVDAGGLRKEWFLLLVREIFDPNHGMSYPIDTSTSLTLTESGMFVYDEESKFCYFNPHVFETSDQFYLVGVLLGLAIYNSTILDIPFPPFTFKKLLAAAPHLQAPSPTNPARVTQGYTLEDLAEFRPSLARGLRQLLEYDGDVEATYCWDFVVAIERYGQTYDVPLCSDGQNRPVTNANRREFVDLYVRYLLDTAVSRQFEPFKRGFYTVCGGNALGLFRPEEIELLVRGSDEPLDISSLRAVAQHENWPSSEDSVIEWFWESFSGATPADQRRLLGFITGSDRIPAMGATNLTIRVSCLNATDSDRYPIARTCFNMLGLYRYSSREKLESRLWTAVAESEGFGLK